MVKADAASHRRRIDVHQCCARPWRPSVAVPDGIEGADMLARLSLGAIALCLGAGAAIADPLTDCTRGANAAARLRACTVVIDGAEYGADDKAMAFRSRGNAR